MNALPSTHSGMVRRSSLVAACAVALFAAGCSDKAKPASQVAARVNNEEISVHQVDFVLQRQGEVSPSDAARLGHEALDRLIDQELALQKASELGLDRDPQVSRAIDSARREILAQAYVDRMTASVARPTPQEIKQYYDSKPAMFAQRNIYDLHEISVEATPDQLQAVQTKINATKTSDEALALLRGANLQHELRHSSIAPESLPAALMDRIASAGRNKAVFLTAPGGAKVVYVVDIRPAPVTEATAAPKIERYLINERKRQMARQDVKNLRTGARIEYLGAFAQAEQATPAAERPAQAKPAAQKSAQ